MGSLSGEGTYVFNGNLVNGVAVGVLPNPKLQWEEAKKFDVGLDAGFFGNKIETVLDYFIDTRDNLLIGNIPVSGITGVYAPGSGSPTVNAGSVRNSGLEFSINYKESLSNNFKIKLYLKPVSENLQVFL